MKKLVQLKFVQLLLLNRVKGKMIKKPCCSRFLLHKFVQLKHFWTQFKNMHLQGPCSLSPCISRPYCTKKNFFSVSSSWKKIKTNIQHSNFKLRQNQICCWDAKDINCFNVEIPMRLHKWFEPIVKAWSKHPLNRAETKSSSYLLLVIAVIF